MVLESGSICCFCLGNEDEVPSFGTAEDAKDMIHPCSTCSIISHRKCLIDWFNSLPADSIHVVDTSSIHEAENVRRDNSVPVGSGERRERETAQIHINLSTQSLSRWITNITNELRTSNLEGIQNLSSKSHFVIMHAQCPHCKEYIVFSMERSPYFALNTWVRSFIIRTTQYGGILMGVSFAFAGICSMGYIGMTTCGIKMVECIIPQPLLLRYYNQGMKSISANYQVNTIPQIFNARSYAIDNYDRAVYNGYIDPILYYRTSMLPFILYRMRSSSLISTLSGYSSDKYMSNLVEEVMISGYLSSLGNHELLIKLVSNLKSFVTKVFHNPRSIRYSVGLFNGIDFWKTNNMISSLFLVRWGYDLFYRLTFNQGFFKDTLKIRPRDIANSLSPSELEEFERVNADIQNLKLVASEIKRKVIEERKQERIKETASILNKALNSFKDHIAVYRAYFAHNLPLSYMKLKIINWYHSTKACLKNDYSAHMLHRSTTIRIVTSTLWPWCSSKLADLVILTIFQRVDFLKKYPNEKVVLLSKLVGLLGVAILKDWFNLNLSHRKTSQISKMRVLEVVPINRYDKFGDEEVQSSAPESSEPEFLIPGNYSD